MKNHTCPTCKLSGFLWHEKCNGCRARKIIYLRSGDRKTTVKLQKAVLANLRPEDREEVLDLVALLDKSIDTE